MSTGSLLTPPFPLFSDTDGTALENGYIYVGTSGLDPKSNAISVYWDEDLTIPAAQPIRTTNGYPSNNGKVARIYTGVSYSIIVENKNNVLVYSSLTELGIFQNIEYVNIIDFGADPSGTNDSTASINNAVASLPATGGTVFVPDGTYVISSTVNFGSISKNVDVKFGNNAVITSVGSSDINFYGYIIATPNQIFSGSVNPLLQSGYEQSIYCEWFGSNGLSKAVTMANSLETDVILNYSNTLSANITIPNTLTLNVLHDGEIGGSFNFDLEGDLKAGMYKIFDSNVTVDFKDTSATFEAYAQWWGATGDGTTDDTAAFQSVIDSGVGTIKIPNGNYSVNGIVPANRQNYIGSNREQTVFTANTNNGAVFTYAPSSGGTQYLAESRFERFRMTAASGVTNAYGFKQINTDGYTSYCVFKDIESYLQLEISYKGFYIFCTWENCLDGQRGSAVGGQNHQAINCQPAAFGQGNQTNINQLVRSQFFGSTDTEAGIDIAYGANWAFEQCDFEGQTTRAVRARGIYNIRFESCWFENHTAAEVVKADISPAPNAQGSRPVVFKNCYTNMTNVTTYFVNAGSSSNYSVEHCMFDNVGSGVVLANENPQSLEECEALSGAGSAGFLTGFTSTTQDTVIKDSTIENSVVPAPNSQQISMLPLDPYALSSGSFSVNDDDGGGTATIANVASNIGLTGSTALELTMVADNSWVWYSMPSKLVTFLQSKTITFSISGEGDGSAASSDGLTARIWEDVTPSSSNQAAASANSINVASQSLQTAYVSYTVGASATSLHFGFQVGGSNNSDTVVIELMALLLGTQLPTITPFR